MTAAWLTKTPIAPAMKKAGIRQRSTCSRAYHLTRWRDSVIAPSKRALPTGSQKQARKTARIQASGLHSVFHSISSPLSAPAGRHYLAE
jgi:hypothetical protein